MRSQKAGENHVVYPIEEDETVSITVLPEGTITLSKAVHVEFSPSQAYRFAAGMIEAARVAEAMK